MEKELKKQENYTEKHRQRSLTMALPKNYTVTLDDDPTISKLIEKYSGVPTVGFTTLEELLSQVSKLKPSAAFIDINLSDKKSGLTILPTLRQYWPYCPLLVVTSETDPETLSEAFIQGADDFVKKPINKTEFIARLKLRLKDSQSRQEKKTIRLSDLTFNSESGTLKGHGKTEYLAPTIQKLLIALYEQKGVVATHEQIKARVWGDVKVTDNALDRKLSELRKTIKELDSKIEIKNLYGKGFLLVLEDTKESEKLLSKSESRETSRRVSATTANTIRVMLLEDEEPDAALVLHALKGDKSTRFEIKWNKTVEEALKNLNEGNIDIILTDLHVPDGHGVETFQKLFDHFSQIPIIILSGNATDEMPEECINLGAQDYIRKNEIGTTLLSKTIRYAISRNMVRHLQLSQAQSERDQAEKVAKLKARFLASMSHEIRTPMNGVIGTTSLLLRTSLNKEQREYVETIRSSGKVLIHLVNDILDYSKIDSGKVTLENTSFNIKKITRDTLELFTQASNSKSISLSNKFEDNVPENVTGDPTRLTQILVNLIGNAVKFTEKGGVTLTVAAQFDSDSVMLRFEVQDTGIGMNTDFLEKGFDAFLQEDNSSSRKFGGTGLGLVITQKLVELFNGSLFCESKKGQGTKFIVEIPVKKASTEDSVVVVSSSAPYPTHDKQLPVLVVEDNPVNQRMILRMLEKLGMTSELVSDGKQAVAIAKKGKYSLILMDCLLPEMDGYEATVLIKANGITTPIIAMTANAFKEDREKCFKSGMEDFLAKPLVMEDLEAICKRWLPSEVLNPATLKQLEEMNSKENPYFVNELFQLFLENAPPTFEELEKSLKKQNAEQVRRQAHRLKGIAYNLGAEKVVSLCQIMENAGKESKIAGLEVVLQETKNELDAVLDFIKKRMAETLKEAA